MKQEVSSIVERQANRRSFLKTVGLTGLGIAGATIVDVSAKAQTTGLTATDVEVLNFALNLEYLEAEFYTMSFYGMTLEQYGIPTSGVGQSGPTTGGKKVDFVSETNHREVSGKLTAVAEEITYDEQTHVKLLRSILGSKAIAKPQIDLDAVGIGFANFSQFLGLARAFEDLGVSAYGGAAPLLSPTTLATAARVALTEAYHASSLRLLCAENSVESLAFDKLDVPPPPASPKFFNVDAQGLSIVRTPSQVLAVAYGKATPGTSKGAFFPKGVNGAITTV